MSITINDTTSEQGATNARDAIKEIDHLMVSISLLIGQVEAESGADVSEMQLAHENLEAASTVAFMEINGALGEYNSEVMHAEGLETTGRV